jgi:hypothetical protein
MGERREGERKCDEPTFAFNVCETFTLSPAFAGVPFDMKQASNPLCLIRWENSWRRVPLILCMKCFRCVYIDEYL